MNVFEDFVANQLTALGNDSSYDDEDVYARMRDAFKIKNRENFATKEEADLNTADALSGYSGVKTLSQMDSTVQAATTTPAPVQQAEVVAPVQAEEGTALGFSVDNAQKLFGSAVATIGDLVGVEGISEFGKEYVAKQEREILENNYQSTYNKGGIETLSEDGAGAFLGWLGESILENFATTGFALAGGATAAALSGPLAAVVGAATLTGTTALGVGEVRQELEDKGVYDEDDALFATGAGLVVGLLDRFGGKGPAKGAVVSALAQRGVLKDLGVAAAKEFGTEAAQESAVIGSAAIQGAKYEPTELYNRVIDAGIIGGAMGAGTKGTVRALSGIVPNAETLEEAPLEDAEGTAQATPADDTTVTQEPADGALGEPTPAPGTGETVRQVTLDDGSTFNVDASIAPLVRDINNAGYKTSQSQSGLIEDYEGTDGADRYTDDGYMSFPLADLSDAQVAEITKAAQDAGLAVDPDAKVFGVPSLSVRTGISESGKTSTEITREAGFAASEELGYTDDQIDQGGRDTIVGASIGGTPLKSAQGLRGGDSFMEFINLRTEKENELKALDPNIGNDEIKARWSAFGSALTSNASAAPEDVATGTTGAVDGEPVTPVDEAIAGPEPVDTQTTPEVVPASIKGRLESVAVERVDANKDARKTSFASWVQGALSYDQNTMAAKTRRQEVFDSWVEDFSGAESYGEVKKIASDAAKAEIVSLIQASGVTVDVGKTAKDRGALNFGLGKNSVGVDAVDKVRGGILSARVPGENYTYAEGLNAIVEAYGRGASGVDYSEAGNKHATELAESIFSAQARAVVSPFIATGVDRGHLLYRPDTATSELQDSFQTRKQLQAEFSTANSESAELNELAFSVPTDGSVLPENSGAVRSPTTAQQPIEEPISLVGRARGAGVVPEQEALGDKARARLDTIAEFVGLKSDGYINKTYKKFADQVQFGVLASQDTALSKALRDAAGESGANRAITSSVYREFKKLGKKYSKGIKDSDASLDDLYSDILTGRQSVLLKDEAKAASFDNIVQDGNGNAYLRSEDGVGHTKIAVEMLGPLSTFMTARIGEQKALIDAANAKINADLEDRDALRYSIEQTLIEARDIVEAEGNIEDFDFKAFQNTQTGLDWVADLQNVEGNHLGLILKNAIDRLAKDPNATATENAELSDELHSMFVEAAAESNNLAEFTEKTGEAFNDADGTIAMDFALALGLLDGKGKMNQVGRLIAQSVAISDRIDSQIEFNSTVANNGHYVADLYEAYVGRDISWVDGMAVPVTDKQKAARKAYEDSVAEKLLETSKARGIPLTEEQAATKAKYDVQQQVEEVRGSQEQLQGGGQDQHLLFSALNSSRAKQVITPEFEAFFGKITDPNILMEETINRMRENAYARTINKFIYDTFEQDGLFENEAAVDRYNYAHSPEVVAAHNDAENARNAANPHYAPDLRTVDEINFHDLTPIKVRDKHNLSVPRNMYAHPTVAQSQEQFGGVTSGDNKIINFLQRYGAEFRLLHTVASLPTGMLNLIAGTTTMIMAGGNPLKVASGTIEHDMATELFNVLVLGKVPTNDDFVDALRAVAGSNAKAGQIQRDKAISQGIIDKILAAPGMVPVKAAREGSKGARQLWQGYINTGEVLYRFGDLLPKMVAYGNTKRKMTADYSSIMTEAELTELAARHTRDMSFDMAQVPSIVRTVREKFLLGGAFLSYDSLLFATVTKNLRNITELRHLDRVKWGSENIKNFNPETDMDQVDAGMTAQDKFTSYGAQRYGYMTASMAAPLVFNAAVVAGVMSIGNLFGEDDEGEPVLQQNLGGITTHGTAVDNMRQLMPDYYRNSTITPINVTKNGAIEWMDTGRMTNHGKFMEGYNAMFNSDPSTSIGQAARNGVGAMFGGYFTPGFGFSAASELLQNRTEYGQEIYNEGASIVDNATSIAEFVLNDIGGTATITRLVKAGTAVVTDSDSLLYNQYSGEETSPAKVALEHVGVRIKTFDPVKELQSRINAESYKLRADKTLFRSHLKTFNKAPDHIIESKLSTLRAAYKGSMQVMHDKIMAARGLGMTEDDIKLSLKGKVTAKESKSLLANVLPELDLGRMGQRNTKSNSIRRIESTAKTNFADNFLRASEINNSL